MVSTGEVGEKEREQDSIVPPLIACFSLFIGRAVQNLEQLYAPLSLRTCDQGYLLQGDLPQAKKSLFNGQDDEVWVLGDPRCGDLPRGEEELLVTALVPKTACLLDTLEQAPVPGDGDHCGFWSEAQKTLWRERQFDPGSCHVTLGDNLSRLVHDDRVVERIWSTPG